MFNSILKSIIGFFQGMLKSIEYAQTKKAEAATKYFQDRWY